MKKVLLMALMALVTCSLSAQKLAKKNVGKAVKSQTNLLVKSQKKIESSVAFDKEPGLLVRADGAKCFDKSVLKILKFSNASKVTVVSRRVGTVQTEYTGSGRDYLNESAPVTWKMSSATLEDGTLALIDVIPNPFEGIDYIPVTYTIDGNIVKVVPQMVASGGGYYVFVFSWTNLDAGGDGSIVLTLGDDGSLTTVKDEDISYGAFTSDTFPTPDTFASVKNGGTYAGSYQDIEKVNYLLPSQIVAPVVMYEPEGLYLHAHYSPTFYGYGANYSVIPANGLVPFKNTTADLADIWSWSVSNVADEPITVEGADFDFAFKTIPGEVYTPAELTASNQGMPSQAYKWGLMGVDSETGEPNYTAAYLFAGESQSDFQMSDGTYSTFTKCNPDFHIAYYNFLGTPDVNSNNYSLSSLILYQGKPSVPFYFEGISYLVRGFTANDNFNLKCKIQKAIRSSDGKLNLGDVIAESDIDVNDVFFSESGIAQLNWKNFYVEDEFGMTKTLDYMFVEDEFVVVIEGWDNGSFSAMPYGEYDYNENGLTSTFIKQTGDDGVYRFSSLYSHQLIGFNGATYGYLYTEDSTDVSIPAEGGEAKIHVDPMLYTNSEEQGVVTRIFLDENIEGNEIPEWLEVTYTNPVQAGVDDDGYPVYDLAFELDFKAETLPEGVEGRQADLVFFQEGAQLKVTVTQGTVTGIAATKVEVKSNNSQMFNLAGQRVNKGYKGLVIKNGRKMLNK